MKNNNVWPIILIVVGALLLINSILPFGIPIGKVLVAGLLIWLGVSMFSGNGVNWKKPNHDYRSDESSEGNEYVEYSGIFDREDKNNKRTYSFVFSSNRIDLRDATSLPKCIEVNNVFGSTHLRLPVDYNITIQASGAFCSISMPNKQNIVMGENVYHYGTQDPAAPTVNLKINCVFGSVQCIVG